MDPQETISQIRSRRERLVAVLSDLVAARTENPPGDEWRAAAVVEEFLRRAGIPCEKREKAQGRTNVIGRVGRGTKPRAAVICHLDTVPAGEGWLTEPFRATVREGRLYGRGAKDDKGPLAAALVAFELLKEHEAELAGQALLVGAADEERGSQFGTHFLLEDDEFRTLDAAIIPDAGSHMDGLDLAEKGLLFVKITCHGRQAHGSRPESGVNAIYPMSELAVWLRRWKMPGGTNDLFIPPTATKNVGVIKGGAAPNMVPGSCEMQVDMRYLPGTERDQLLAALTNTLDRLEAKFPGAWFELEPMMEEVPTAVAADSPVCAALAAAVEAVTGRRPRPFGMSGATVAKQFIAAGVPAVGLCPGDPETEHAANEYVPLDEVVDFAAVLVLALVDILGRK
jgi:acetylornithine deacetylase/succinyl-diaminopimelate desuccinylase family protein